MKLLQPSSSLAIFFASLLLPLLHNSSSTAPTCAGAYMVPRIIQGGMGIRISSWQLARQVSRQGELGVVSGTGIDTVVVRILQTGDSSGDMRRALASFPDQDMASRFLEKYYIKGGKAANKPFRSLPMWTIEPSQGLLEAAVISNYCEVWLAKHDDDGSPTAGIVGMNRLTKVALPTIASLYGAMLADVDYIIMGAGIPLHVPGVLDALSTGQDATFPIEVTDSKENYSIKFSPKTFWDAAGTNTSLADKPLNRPAFVPIVSSVVLAQSMLKRADGQGPTKGIDGFVVELPTAGGHNAPPRGFRYDPVAKSHAVDLNDKGEPVYGVKDHVDLEKFVKATKGVPFWLAGSYAHAEKLTEVLEMGGAGVQVGTLFALAKESGMDDTTKQLVLNTLAEKDFAVFTDPVASPTGYPFKVLKLDNTLSEEAVYEERPRVCNLGYLRTPYIGSDGKIGYRCPAEPVKDWVKKGGDVEATVGRKCLCNSLMANVDLPQTRTIKTAAAGEKSTYVEDMLITVGDEVNCCRQFMKQDEDGNWSYSADAVVHYLKSELEEREAGDLSGQV